MLIKSSMGKKGKKICLLLTMLFLMALGVGYTFLGKKNEAGAKQTGPQTVRPVKVMTLRSKAHTEQRSFPAVVQAAREVDLAFRVGGPLVELNVEIGQQIKQGAVMARIDPRDFKLNCIRLAAALKEAQAGLKAMKSGARAEDIASLKAQLKAAQAQMADAETNYQRQRKLLAHGATARAAYENARTAYDTARANVDVVRQNLKKARSGARIEDIQAAEAGIKRLEADIKAAANALKDTVLRAPFSGYVGQKHVDNYESVEANKAIFTLLDFSRVEVRSAVPEDIIIRQDEIAAVNCTLDAYRGQTFAATIKTLGRKTDAAHQSYPLTASLTLDQNRPIRPGMAATLEIILTNSKNGKSHADRFMVPMAAVFADSSGRSCVWRVDTKTMRVVKTAVAAGRLHKDEIEITKGLSAGDQLVVAGARFLAENQKIRVLKSEGGRAQ